MPALSNAAPVAPVVIVFFSIFFGLVPIGYNFLNCLTFMHVMSAPVSYNAFTTDFPKFTLTYGLWGRNKEDLSLCTVLFIKSLNTMDKFCNLAVVVGDPVGVLPDLSESLKAPT